MRRYRFNLQTLLDVRANEEKEVQGRLSLALGELRDAQRQKENYLAAIERDNSGLMAAGNVDVRLLQLNAGMRRGNLFRVQQVERDIDERQRKVDRIRSELARVSANKKVLEKLRDRRAQEHYREMARREESESEDMIIMREGRR